jgi:hypothetical protein
MPQIGMFPLSDAELKQKAKLLAGKIREHDELAEEKDTTSREYNEKLKKLQGEIRLLAKTIETEQEEREARDAEAPWQGLIDQAEEVAKRGRRRTRRDVDGEVIAEEGEP